MSTSSIHFQRRWHYAFWIGLLFLSLLTLLRWETPVRAGHATLRLEMELSGFPGAGGRATAWVGPRSAWLGPAWRGEGAWGEVPFAQPKLSFPPIKLPVAHRRWVGGFIPRKTADLLVVKFQADGHAPRYFAFSLAADWHYGLLRMDREFGLRVPLDWNGLWEEPPGLSSLH